MDPLPQPGLLTVKEVAQRLSVSQSFVRQHQHELQAVRIGTRSLRFRDEAITEYVQRRVPQCILPAREPAPTTGEEQFHMVVRRWQRGSVMKTKTQNPQWVGRWREDQLTADSAVTRRMRKVYLGSVLDIPTKSQALAVLARVMHERAQQKPTTIITFAEAVRRWSSVAAVDATTNGYRKLLRNHIEPVFATRPVGEITRYDVERFYAQKAPAYSRSMLKQLRVAIQTVLKWARSHGWVHNVVTEGLRLPKRCGGKLQPHHPLSPTDLLRLERRLEEPFATLVHFLGRTGLRIGEACALRWSDLQGNILHVSRNLKTKSSDRKLVLPVDLVERLRRLGTTGDTIFTNKHKPTPLIAGNVRNRYLRPAYRALGIEYGGFHDCRHGAATTLVNSGVDVKTVAQVLGHGNVRTTLDTYRHVRLENVAVALERLSCDLRVTSEERVA